MEGDLVLLLNAVKQILNKLQGGFVTAIWNFRSALQHRQGTVTILRGELRHQNSDKLLLFVCTQGAAIQQQFREKVALTKSDFLVYTEIFQTVAAQFPVIDQFQIGERFAEEKANGKYITVNRSFRGVKFQSEQRFVDDLPCYKALVKRLGFE